MGCIPNTDSGGGARPTAAGRYMRPLGQRPYRGLVGVGGIGWGMMFELEGDHTLGRNESRPARLLDCRDYCKLHIVAHNVAILMGAAQGSGFHVLPMGKVGRDGRGSELLGEMSAAGMDLSCVGFADGRPTTLSVCFQYPDGSGGNITSIESASAAVVPEDIDRAAARLRPPPSGYVALALPEVPLETRFHFLHSARSWGCYNVASFASAEMNSALTNGVMECVDLLAVNHDELEALVGRKVDPGHSGAALDACVEILTKFQPGIRIVATMGAHGAFAFDGGAWHHCPALSVAPVSTAGAGDALLAGVVCALAVGAPLAVGETQQTTSERPIRSALEFGVLVAGLKITSRHTINPDLNVDTLLEFAAEHGVVLAGALAEAIQPSRPEACPTVTGL